MFKKYLLLISSLGISKSSCFIPKEIPDHVAHKYKTVDPKKEIFVPTDHGLTEEHFVPKPRDVTRRKGNHEIRRVKDRHYEVEELEHHEVLIDKHHIEDARKHHRIDLKKRKRLSKE